MKKNERSLLLLTTVLCLAPMVLAAILYHRLPDQIAIHFSSTGEPDNYLPKFLASYGLPAALALFNAYVHFRLNHDPKRENASLRLKQVSKWALPAISLIAMPITLFLAMGSSIPLGTIITAIAGFSIVISGNYLPKCKRNYTMGIRLPWTLSSEENWNKTHRFAGYVFVAGGFLFILNAFMAWAYGTILLVALLIILPVLFSYFTYRHEEKKA